MKKMEIYYWYSFSAPLCCFFQEQTRREGVDGWAFSFYKGCGALWWPL